jgi:16S rRNA (guanine966-N2)-methyltransferase
VKETLFNKTMGQWEGIHVLDLFSGTGSLGLEAISRGAEFVEFVESHRKSLRILKENIDKLKIDGGYRIMPVDVFQFLRRYDGRGFEIVLADPPFTQKIADQVLQALSQSRALREGTLVIIESSRQETVQNHYPRLNLLDRKSFSDKDLSFYEAKDE